MNKPNRDLYLKYKFTDRGGSHVFDIYYMPAGIDIMQRAEDIVGETRMQPDWEDVMTMATPEASNEDPWLCTNGNAHIVDAETGVCAKCHEKIYEPSDE